MLSGENKQNCFCEIFRINTNKLCYTKRFTHREVALCMCTLKFHTPKRIWKHKLQNMLRFFIQWLVHSLLVHTYFDTCMKRLPWTLIQKLCKISGFLGDVMANLNQHHFGILMRRDKVSTRRRKFIQEKIKNTSRHHPVVSMAQLNIITYLSKFAVST